MHLHKEKKTNIHHEALMKAITSAALLELMGIDFLHPGNCSGDYEYILIITDHFTKFTQVYPTAKKSGKKAADKLYNDYIMRYRIPEKILSDRGKELDCQSSAVIRNFAQHRIIHRQMGRFSKRIILS